MRGLLHRVNASKTAIPEYASRFFSDPGKNNGLYCPTDNGEKPSPLGPLVAYAEGKGYHYAEIPAVTVKPRPFHGYLYRILTAQGKDAPGGAADYVVNGKLIGGFAVLAWPVSYGNSGVMTFIANYRGEVYQKNLGPDTATVAPAIIEYNRDASWNHAE